MTADVRTSLGQLGVDLDIGAHGPVFRKWWDTSFTRKIPAALLQPYKAELNMLVTALDEYHAGRVVEVGDILASRIRMLTAALSREARKVPLSWRVISWCITPRICRFAPTPCTMRC